MFYFALFFVAVSRKFALFLDVNNANASQAYTWSTIIVSNVVSVIRASVAHLNVDVALVFGSPDWDRDILLEAPELLECPWRLLAGIPRSKQLVGR